MKKTMKLSLVTLTFVLLSGCAVLDAIIPKVETPKTPAAFRAGVNTQLSEGSDNVFKKSYIVKKPYSYVVKRWKQRSNKCLKQKIKTTTSHGFGPFANKQVSFKDFKPSLKVKRNKTVLSIQMKHYGEGVGSNAINPPGGAYFMVLDAIPLKGNKTRINEYRWNLTMSNFGVVSKSIVNWASGRSKACPDYQKIW